MRNPYSFRAPHISIFTGEFCSVFIAEIFQTPTANTTRQSVINVKVSQQGFLALPQEQAKIPNILIWNEDLDKPGKVIVLLE